MLRQIIVIASIVSTTALSVESRADSVRSHKPVPATSASMRAWDDLQWLRTALEAYAIDHDFLFAPTTFASEGNISDYDRVLAWNYKNTYPKKSAPPRLDPWGRQYRFVLSGSRKAYALYSLGATGKLDAATAAFLERLKNDQLTEDDMTGALPSTNIVVSTGLSFATPDVLKTLDPALLKKNGLSL